MIKLSKKIEYGLLAVQYIAKNSNKIVSAKEISENMNLSFEFLSKTLQMLMKHGLIKSVQGINGGYSLTQKPDKISVADIIFAIEGKSALVECFSKDAYLACERDNKCSIKSPLRTLQKKIDDVFHSTSIAEIAKIKTI